MDIWTEKEIEFLKENYKNYSFKELSEILGRTQNAIKIKSSKLGLKQDKKYYYNKRYFKDIDNSEKSYWLGFIYADGYVTSSGNHYCVGIELNQSDYNHLRKFNKAINGNVKIEVVEKHNKEICGRKISDTGICKIRLWCMDMMNDLISHGCCRNKSLIKQPPVGIPENLMRDFIRGYFDGNGSITSSYNKKVDKSYLKITIDSGSYNFINWLSIYLNNIGFKNTYRKDGKNSYKLQLSYKANITFLKYLYENSKTYLDRKYQKYKIAVYGEDVVRNHK